MNPSWESITIGVALFATMAAYALFAGADFGGGIWDLLAGGSKRGSKPRAAIDASVTPVWEGNQVWIVLGFVLLWTAFPTAFAAVMTSLFVPLALSLLGIVLRGIGFAFRHEAKRRSTKRLTGVLFATASSLAPFFLGTAVGAVATGQVRPSPRGNDPAAWTSPTALVTGALFVSACAYIGGVYLVGDCHRRGEQELARYFSRRAVAAGVLTGTLAGINLLLMHTSATYVFDRLVGLALPLVVLSGAAGAAAFVLIVLRRYWALRIASGTAVASVVAAWGLAQYPWLLPRTLSLQAGSAPSASLLAELAVVGLAAVLVVPSFAYLYWLQQHGRLTKSESSHQLRLAAAVENRAPAAAQTTRRHPIVTTVLVSAAALELLREAIARARNRHRDGPP